MRSKEKACQTKKIDNLFVPHRLHQEDFAQALGISSTDKYEPKDSNYLQKMVALLKNYSSSPIVDQLKLWDICIYNYLIGNADDHIKNLSLLYDEELKQIRLAPAYDIVSTFIYKETSTKMGLKIGSESDLKKNNEKIFQGSSTQCWLRKSNCA